MNFGLKFGIGNAGESSALVISSINETASGSCDLLEADPCTATSTHQVVVSNPRGTITYVWTTVETIASGQGTDIITVSSSGSVSSTFDVTCEVTDSITGTAIKTVSVSHTRDKEIR